MLKKKATDSPSGVGYFQQFTRNFLRPYGQADDAPDLSTIIRRIKPFTCEWLLRPKVAMSEMSATVSSNMAVLQDEKYGAVLNKSFVQKLLLHINPMLDTFHHLEKGNEQEATQADVITLLKFLYRENDELDTIVDNMFKFGGAMFAMSCQLIIARNLIRNPEIYAQEVSAADKSDREFQNKKDIKTMKQFLVNSVLPRFPEKTAASARRRLETVFDDDVASTPPAAKRRHDTAFDEPDESEPPVSFKKNKKKKNKGKN